MRPLLTGELMGGLGNQLFQIATAYAYARKYDMELIFPENWNTAAERPPIWRTYFYKSESPFQLMPREQFQHTNWYRISESGFAYRPLASPPKGFPFYKLFGYFQSSLYFAEYADEIRNLFEPSSDVKKKARAALQELGITDTSGWIAAHVRRGDYLNAADYHVVTTPAYFKGARDEIESTLGGKRGVVWITEDVDWVYKTCFREGDKVIHNDSITDFVTLSLFQHIIMSNSSFSWWAVWLNSGKHTNRQICCPSHWFGPRGPKDTETIYEEGWKRIDPASGNVVR